MVQPLASFKDLCIDAVDVQRSAQFWAAALGLQLRQEEGFSWLHGPTPQHRIWINPVPEAKTAKNRVHLDVHTGSLQELEKLGAQTRETFPRWTIMTDPDGQEFCAFVRETPPDYRFYELVVDAVDPARIAEWWAEVFGVPLIQTGEDWELAGIEGMPFDCLLFQQIPEPKTVKNRVHWDVRADPKKLLAAGATLLRPKGGDIGWHVMADPEGNEFCAFDD